MEVEVHVAVINHKYGSNVEVASSHEELMDKIHEYVRTWWTKEYPNEIIPENRDAAIDAYFGGEFIDEWVDVLDPATLEFL